MAENHTGEEQDWMDELVAQALSAGMPPGTRDAPGAAAGLAAWSEQQLHGIDLGNPRRHARFCALLTRLAQSPRETLPAQCRTSAELKGAYRAVRYPKVKAADLMAGHRGATLARIEAQPPEGGVLLAVQDTTTLNFSTHHALSGQGPIGQNSKATTTGFHAHGTMLLSAQSQVFGMLESEFYARDAKAHADKRKESLNKRNRQKAQDKESARWLRSLRLSAALAATRSKQSITVNVADREADMYELWLLHSQLRLSTPQLHLLVRSQHNRKLEGSDELLHDHLGAQPAMARWELELPAAKGLGAQQRQVEALWQQVRLAVPAHQKKHQGHDEAQSLWVIEVREPSPPAGAQPLHWIILSTWPISDEKSARQALGWYVQRWQIEVLHRTWKTGCKVEGRRVQDPRAMQCLMMLDLMVAVGLLSLVKSRPAHARSPREPTAGQGSSRMPGGPQRHERSSEPRSRRHAGGRGPRSTGPWDDPQPSRGEDRPIGWLQWQCQ